MATLFKNRMMKLEEERKLRDLRATVTAAATYMAQVLERYPAELQSTILEQLELDRKLRALACHDRLESEAAEALDRGSHAPRKTQLSELDSASEHTSLRIDGSRMFRLRELPPYTGISKTTIYRLVKSGDFPQPWRPTKYTVAWRESDIARWAAELPSRRSREAS